MVLAEQQTLLSLERTFLATERTLMAWMRTSLSMISFGFGVAKIFEHLYAERQLTVGVLHSWAPATIGLVLIISGPGPSRWRSSSTGSTLRNLRRQGLEPRWSLALAVASLVAVLGVFALGSVVLRY